MECPHPGVLVKRSTAIGASEMLISKVELPFQTRWRRHASTATSSASRPARLAASWRLRSLGPITVTVELPRGGKSLALTGNCHVKAS
jgi:hypothetical protein